MQLRCRDMEWWMKRRQLPSRLRQRVRQYERQRWATMRGEDEMEMIKDLPEGLRRDIKRYLCLDLIKQVLLKDYTALVIRLCYNTMLERARLNPWYLLFRYLCSTTWMNSFLTISATGLNRSSSPRMKRYRMVIQDLFYEPNGS